MSTSSLPMPLVSTRWLARHLTLPDLVVLDASVDKHGQSWRSGARAYREEGHIPGALFADLITAFSHPAAPLAFTRPDAARFAAAAGRLGVSGKSRVVIYDRAEGIWAARLWWLFRAFGHEAVSVLDGGLANWRQHGYATESGAGRSKTTIFTAREQDGLFTERDEVRAVLAGDVKAHLVCVLRRPVFAGIEQPYARAGHIPGSINIPFKEQINSVDHTLHARAALTRDFAPLLGDDLPVILYCGGGITAAGSALALTLLGRRRLSIYDGSLSEWSADPALPLATAST